MKFIDKDNVEGVERNIVENTSMYVIKNNTKSLVLGVSGGIDSCVIACLAKEVCNITGIKLIGISLPSKSNKDDEVSRAMAISGLLCDSSYAIPVNNLEYAFRCTSPVFWNGLTREENIRIGNIKARIRMIILYHYAHLNNGIVLSTDNYTEYLLGFWTLHGDVGDYGMIQELFKTEVYEIAKFYRDIIYKDENVSEWINSCINAVPTDGLGITDSDFDQIGAESYEEVDDILVRYMRGDETLDTTHPVIQMVERTRFKRDNPHNLKREEIVK